MRIDTFSLPSDIISKMVNCVEDAVGDGIQADTIKIRTKNSVPSRIWDLLNTNLLDSLEIEGCSAITAHRGPWEMVVVYEKTSNNIFTFMREKRFADLQKSQRQRNHLHYVDMLAKQFNSDLLAEQGQVCLFPHEFSDELRLAELVQSLLVDLGSDLDLIQHHVIVLFDASDYRLNHIRAIMVTSDLEIAKDSEQDWSGYISHADSVIVDKVSDSISPENQPTRALALTEKALARKSRNLARKQTESSEEHTS